MKMEEAFVFAAIIVYFLFPIDLIPDIAFPVGYLDDVVVAIVGTLMTRKQGEK